MPRRLLMSRRTTSTTKHHLAAKEHQIRCAVSHTLKGGYCENLYTRPLGMKVLEAHNLGRRCLLEVYLSLLGYPVLLIGSLKHLHEGYCCLPS